MYQSDHIGVSTVCDQVGRVYLTCNGCVQQFLIDYATPSTVYVNYTAFYFMMYVKL